MFDVAAARAAAVYALQSDPDVEIVQERELALDDNAPHGSNRPEEMTHEPMDADR